MEKQQKIMEASGIFEGSFLEPKAYYMYCYQKVPNVLWVDRVNTEKVFAYIKEQYGDTITGIFQDTKYCSIKKRIVYYSTIILMNNDCLVELSDDSCEVLYAYGDYEMAGRFASEISRFRRREKKKNFEIYLVNKNNYGLNLKAMEIKKTSLDLGLYYNDDFLEVDRLIRERLSRQNDKGIVLLHGLPGTGKTTYLRSLVGRLKKRVLFISPSMAGSIMNPEFMELLIDNPNSIVLIEDAENVIQDRRIESDSSVSNLLNISDGLLSDFLNVQLICTFNQPLSMVDQALMRKGRLIARYEFGKLNVSKAQRLSRHLGFDTVINRPMTVSEVTNQHDRAEERKPTQVIGFRMA